VFAEESFAVFAILPKSIKVSSAKSPQSINRKSFFREIYEKNNFSLLLP